MNEIILVGRLAHDPEVRMTPTGKSVCQFALAVPRDGVKTETGSGVCDFITCVAWERSGEIMQKWGYKGQKMLVRGRLQIRKWTNKKGDKETAADVVVQNFEFLQRKSSDAEPETETYGSLDFENSDIPF